MTTLENDYLKVNISPIGAELVSFIDKTDGVEHIWEGDPKFWPRKAPILFPCVGESKGRQIEVGGEVFPMGRHGFARLLQFELLSASETEVAFELTDNEETRKSYPFSFSFRVRYLLDSKSLIQRFEVVNTGGKTLGFQVGGHPAFAVPFGNNGKYSDYEIKFDQNQNLERHLLSDEGLYTGEKRVVLDNEDAFGLTYDLFNEDALVFKNIPAKSVCIQHKLGGKKLQVNYTEFTHLGVWSVPGANYVCIEPWIGCADMINQSSNFFEKDNLVQLNQNEQFSASFEITIV